ncbi:chromosome segregation protein SMC [Kiloniella antarctica]|uniref:Chromosome partition protein Smc n=1 Tax=Kiloniella antarctica TaxID=1550907 RepID=A0ABW5BHG6_9PROT
MVQFKKLRLSGFKSFVDQTELLITSGMTGVVGPNGCGKSNLVEALRWVMGETSAKRMRGSEMDDVIFAGSATRPARNIAEVSLLLDNSDRTAPAAFNNYEEIEVIRRISRGSGSNYKVNGKDVRARDVQLLFADAASGSQSTALVSQGRIGEIINARPISRRGLLEEAAGITGLHSRRHEAELRLKAAETNLERLEDVVLTLDAQLQGLKKQARQANRYRNLAQLIRQHEAILLHYESVEANSLLCHAEEQLKIAQNSVSKKTKIAAQKSTAQVTIAATLPSLRETETSAATQLQKLLVSQENLQQEERQAITALSQAQELLAQLNKDKERAASINKDALDAEKRLTNEHFEIEQKKQNLAQDQKKIEELCKSNASEVAETDGQIAQIGAQIATNEAQTSSLTRQISEFSNQTTRLEQLIENQQKLTLDLSSKQKSDSTLTEINQHLDQAETNLNHTKNQATNAELTLQTLREEEGETRDALQETQNNYQKITAEFEALTKMLHHEIGGVSDPILEELTVKSGYEKALGAALGEDLNAGSQEEAVAHWHDLPLRTGLPSLPQGIPSLLEVVTAPVRLHTRLSQIGLIETGDITKDSYAQLAPGQRLVSREGTLWRWDGLTIRDDAPSSATVRLEQKNRLEKLHHLKEKAHNIFIRAQKKHSKIKSQLEKSLEQEKDLREKTNKAFNDVSALKNKQIELTREKDHLVHQLNVAEENIGRLNQDHKETLNHLEEIKNELKNLPNLENEKNRISNLKRKLSTNRQALASNRAKLDQFKHDTNRRKQRLANIKEELISWTRRTKEAKQYLSEIDTRIQRIESEISIWNKKPDQLQQQRTALTISLKRAENEQKEATEALRVSELQQAEIDRQLRESEQSLFQAREIMIRAESEVSQAKQSVGVLIDRVRERLGCSLEKALSIAEIKLDENLPSKEDVTRKHARLTSERDNMGPVNLRAEKEAEELDTQIKTTLSDKEDLLLAINKLRQGIANLNKEGRERLLKAFNLVNTHFSELFVRLFGGGRAYLALTDAEDPLQAGLEIMASPPGKRLQVMSLLSGGEQALTALSLLFAVFLTNPAPICVLDEVDAPLDDANVDRFCKLVEELVQSTSTRFLIISHHRMTMARVHRLFGVTMSERGVSQLVSVNLETADELAEETNPDK